MTKLMEDLSAIHETIGGLFRKGDDSKPEQYRISADQLLYFEKHGFLTGIKILSEQQVDLLNASLVRIMDPTHPGHDLFHEFHSNESTDPDKVLFHALGAWRVSPLFHDLLWHPRFTMAAAQLLGGSIRFWHDQLFCKPPLHGGVVAWHQDYSYWTRTKPLAHLTCWIALDDADEKNGCLQYIPGSHRWGLLEKPVLAGNMDEIIEKLSGEQKKAFRPVFARLKKGYATFHHPLLLHGSGINGSHSSRRAAVINVIRDGVRSDVEGEILQGIRPFTKGEKLEGQFFPMLLEVKNGNIE